MVLIVMSSENPKPRNEERLYEPIREFLQNIFANYYVERKKHEIHYQRAPFEYEERNVHVEVIGNTKRFSETLKREFDNDTLSIINNEGIFPDIVGYVRKKSSSPKEIITVEVKDTPIRLKDIAQAKFYKEIFKANFGLLISPKGIPEEKVRFVLGKDVIRGKLIIAQWHEHPYGHRWQLEINSKFKDSVPDPFKRFC
jgi:hypothetical protein